jgi:hypothetical protein
LDLATFRYDQEAGWMPGTFPDWDSPQTLVLVFGCTDPERVAAPLATVVRAFAASHVVGCSTAGEIVGGGIYDDGLAVAVIRFAATPLATAEADVREAGDSFAAGVALARQLDHPDLRGVFVLSDGQLVNGSNLVGGMNSVLAPAVMVTGGLAGDKDRFQVTWTLAGGQARSGRIVAVGFYGDHIHLRHGTRGGWDRFGPERLITRSVQNELFELDGQPALDLYKRYLGDRAAQLPATGLLFPLLVFSDDGRSVVRTILGVNAERHSLIFAGNVPVGHRAQLMKANFERLIQGGGQAAWQARQDVPAGEPALCVAISCIGRRLVLRDRADEEVEAVQQALPPGVQQIGFYSYGEIAPTAAGACDLHNQTMTLTMIAERPAV